MQLKKIDCWCYLVIFKLILCGASRKSTTIIVGVQIGSIFNIDITIRRSSNSPKLLFQDIKRNVLRADKKGKQTDISISKQVNYMWRQIKAFCLEIISHFTKFTECIGFQRLNKTKFFRERLRKRAENFGKTTMAMPWAWIIIYKKIRFNLSE